MPKDAWQVKTKKSQQVRGFWLSLYYKYIVLGFKKSMTMQNFIMAHTKDGEG